MAQQDDDDLRNYQDDLDTDSRWEDEATIEETDDPSEILGVSPRELGDELDKYDVDDGDEENDDYHEAIEDDDEEDEDE